MSTRRGRPFQAYRGIRYAEPPTGELRFQPPKPILCYAGEVDAREEGPSCPRAASAKVFMEEDCLRLNVYTHGQSATLRPVVVYLHPGGFYSGSGRSDAAGPHHFMERDLVFVAINFRLATLGFISTGDKYAPGNNGFKDQVVALKWVQRNIAAFGGDPNLVTLAGYSAGSRSVGLHIVSPMSKGLFHRAISMSASPVCQVVIGPHQRHLAVKQAQLLGCPSNTSKEIIDCLKTKPWREIADSLDSMFVFGFDPVLLWNVVVEPDVGQQRFLTGQPADLIRAGRMHAVPYIVSQTKDEFFWKAYNVLNNATLFDELNNNWEKIAPIAFMLPEKNAATISNRLKDAYLDGRRLANDTKTGEQLGKLYSDAINGFATHRMANLMCRHSPHPVYHYEWAYVGNNSYYVDPTTGKPTAAVHHDELIYLLRLSARFPPIELGTQDDQMVEKLTALWYNFARYGDPNPRDDTPELGALCWPPMTPTERRYLRIDSDFSVRRNLFEDRYAVWNELYPIEY